MKKKNLGGIMSKKVVFVLIVLLSLHQFLFCEKWGEETKSESKSFFGDSSTLKNISISYVFSHSGKLKSDYEYGKWETKLKKYNGWSFLYRMRKPEKLFYLSPYFGFSNFTKKVSKNSWEYSLDKDFKYFYRTISAGANYGININKHPSNPLMSLSLPKELNPYAEIGGGWAFVSMGTGKGFMQLSNKVEDDYWGETLTLPSVWHWLRFGINFGIGTEYFINETMALDLYISYHLNFIDFQITSGTDKKNDWWDDEGNFFDHFVLWGAGLEKLTDQYLRIGLGLTF